jgi:nucleoside-diphosphate-sugar epimerase
MAKYLVTGGAGFIGSHIVRALLEAGHEVRVMDDFSTGKRENLTDCLADIQLYEADIKDLPSVNEAVSGMDYVLHQAALPSVPRSVADPLWCSLLPRRYMETVPACLKLRIWATIPYRLMP